MEYSRFKELRQQRGYNQGALGDELIITGDYVNMIENGRRTPNFALAKQMADFFGVTVFFCPDNEQFVLK